MLENSSFIVIGENIMMGNNTFHEYIDDADDSSDDEEVGAFNSPQPELSVATKKKTPIAALPDIFFSKKIQKPSTNQDVVQLVTDFHNDTNQYYSTLNDNHSRWFQSHQWGWYFIVHQLGIDLLYHPDVENLYREKKVRRMGRSYLWSPSKSKTEIDTLIPQELTKRVVALMLIGKENWLSHQYNSSLSQSVRSSLQQNSVQLYRDNLSNYDDSDNSLFVSHTFCEYLANIRLSNRSIKRYIQGKYTGNYNRKWKLLPNLEQTSEQITIGCDKEGNYYRNDLSNHFGKYAINTKSVLNRINKLMMEYQLSKIDIAMCIRATLRHEIINYNSISNTQKKAINTAIVSLTHLLFGIEGARTPEALIIHQMVLDLIINKPEWIWDRVLGEGFSASFNSDFTYYA